MNSIVGIDSNVLIYAADSRSEQYLRANKFLTEVANGIRLGVITYQNLTEYFATVTNKKKTSHVLTAERAVEEMEKLLHTDVKLVFPNAGTRRVFLEVLRSKKVTAQKVHDVFLAATFISNGVTKLVTENPKDFKGIKGLEVMDLTEYLDEYVG